MEHVPSSSIIFHNLPYETSSLPCATAGVTRRCGSAGSPVLPYLSIPLIFTYVDPLKMAYASRTAAPATASGLGSDAGMREAASKRPAAAAGLGDGDRPAVLSPTAACAFGKAWSTTASTAATTTDYRQQPHQGGPEPASAECKGVRPPLVPLLISVHGCRSSCRLQWCLSFLSS